MVSGPLFLASVSLLMSTPPGGAAPSDASASPPFTSGASSAPALDWNGAFESAQLYARSRSGRVSFVLVDSNGRSHRPHPARHYHSASVVKAMLLVAYLRRHDVRHRRLRSSERSKLVPMIERSDNSQASRCFRIVGRSGLERLARRAGMRHFASDAYWGSTHITAGDQARFFARIDRLVPARHRHFARHVLSHIVESQRWGIPAAVESRARVFFKGGWRPEHGAWVVHQVALVERRGRRAALAVLTDGDPTFGYGTRTVKGIARRALRPVTRQQ